MRRQCNYAKVVHITYINILGKENTCLVPKKTSVNMSLYLPNTFKLFYLGKCYFSKKKIAL